MSPPEEQGSEAELGSEDEPGTILLCGPGTWRDGSSCLALRAPREVVAVREPDGLPTAVAEVERWLAAGRIVAGVLCYEVAAAFGLAAHSHRSAAPLAWFGSYDPGSVAEVRRSGPDGSSPLRGSPPFGPSEEPRTDVAAPILNVSRAEHYGAIGRIKDWIAEGDTYQVNYTCRARFPSPSPPLPYFISLFLSHPVPYAAYLNLGAAQVLSLSPELLLRRRGCVLESRPMKGTRPRGTTERNDAALADELAASAKDRAENLMIVDMVRNDLGRVCDAGSIEARALFSVEKYRTVWQMTSTVRGRLRDGVGLWGILEAVFPGASVTGAPKVRTMEIIRDLETEPRGVYCGAIALFEPDGDFTLSLPIRTITHVDGECELGIGGGIVWDSDPCAEYKEALSKSLFAFRLMPDLELWETVLVDENGAIRYEDEHLERMARSAESWGVPFNAEDARARLREQAAALAHPRVIRLELRQDGCISLAERPSPPSLGRPARLVISAERTDPSDRLLYHKTNQRALYDREREAARRGGYDDVLFRNTSGVLTEGAITNLFVRFADGWVTPPVEEGLLPGIWRAEFMREVGAREEPVALEALSAATEVVIGNSVRGAMPVGKIDLDGRPIYLADAGSSGLSPPPARGGRCAALWLSAGG